MNPMANHVKILGIMHIIFGALGIVVALVLLLVFGGIAGIIGSNIEERTGVTGAQGAAAMGVLSIIGLVIFIVILVLSLPGLIAGIGLLNFRPWARILGIVISALDLIHVPLGTALGVYGLWVLLSTETEALFRNPNAYVVTGPTAPPPLA